MPLIKETARKRFDPIVELLANAIRDEDTRIEPNSTDKNVSYAVYALMKKLYEFGVVNDFVRAIGVLEETKLALYTLEILPLEQLILARRWFDGNAASPSVKPK